MGIPGLHMVFPGFVSSGISPGYEEERNALHDASSHPCPDSESVWNVFIDVVPDRVPFSGIKNILIGYLLFGELHSWIGGISGIRGAKQN
jgi:hypothetical protein